MDNLGFGCNGNRIQIGQAEDDIGVRFYNLYRSDVTIRSVFLFTIGAQFCGNGHGVAYNEIKLLHLVDNKIGLDLVSVVLLCVGGMKITGMGVFCGFKQWTHFARRER